MTTTQLFCAGMPDHFARDAGNGSGVTRRPRGAGNRFQVSPLLADIPAVESCCEESTAMLRRTLLKAGLATAGAALVPRTVIGAYPVDAFLAKQPADALREMLGTADIAPGDAIEIDAPPITTDPDLVTVRVRSGYPDTEAITLVATGNESPLAAHYRLHGGQAAVTTRLRVEETGDLLVVVKAGGQLHSASRSLRVANFCRA